MGLSLTDLWLMFTCDDEQFLDFVWLATRAKTKELVRLKAAARA